MCDSVEFSQKTVECTEHPLRYAKPAVRLVRRANEAAFVQPIFFSKTQRITAPSLPGLVLGGTFERTLAVQRSFMLPRVCAIYVLYLPGRTRLAKPRVWWYFSVVVPPFFPSSLAARLNGKDLCSRGSGRRMPGHEGVEAPAFVGCKAFTTGNLSRRWFLDVGVALGPRAIPLGSSQLLHRDRSKDQGIAGFRFS